MVSKAFVAKPSVTPCAYALRLSFPVAHIALLSASLATFAAVGSLVCGVHSSPAAAVSLATHEVAAAGAATVAVAAADSRRRFTDIVQRAHYRPSGAQHIMRNWVVGRVPPMGSVVSLASAMVTRKATRSERK